MIYTIYDNHLLISKQEMDALHMYAKIDEPTAKDLLVSDSGIEIVFVNHINPQISKCSFAISSPGNTFIDCENISLLEKPPLVHCSMKSDAKSHVLTDMQLPQWLSDLVLTRGARSLNLQYPHWQQQLHSKLPIHWRINIAGLGDVGSMLAIGLRLLGGETVASIGIFDLDKGKVQRHIYECNQILSPFGGRHFPEVLEVNEDNIFDCDMFVFCVTAGVPPVGEEQTDVRLAQYKANSNIVGHYAKKARSNNFNGIFAVVSDPVDQLCKFALVSSNIDENGIYDGKGILPDQIRGYGLGVMNARAVFYAREQSMALHYEAEGRAFGPHGEGLIIADSIENYNHELSLYLTEKAKKANLVVRDLGYKPYIAPALSSAALSIIDTINGNWHYSSTLIGNAFIGAKNRLTSKGTELEQYNLPKLLKQRLQETYERLSDFNG